MSTALAVPEPTSLVAVHDQCSAIEAWADECDSVAELRDAANRLAAIDEYLTRTSTEGRGRVSEAMRRLEVRIGKLIGPATVGAHSSADEGADLTPNQRSDFRKLAENEDVVEKVIAESSDDKPASRKKVLDAIKDVAPRPKAKDKKKANRKPLSDVAAKAAWDFRKTVERLQRIAEDDRFAANRSQVATHLRGHLTYAVEVCQDLLHGFDNEPQEAR